MQNQLKNTEREITLEPKLMEVLVYLCLHAPEVISSDQIIEHCWPNQFLSDNPVHKTIAQLRKSLGDSARNSQYIKTIPKKGYSIIAPIKGLKLIQNNNTKPWIDGSPYPGLHHYNEKYTQVLFGRSKATSEVKYIINQIQPNKQKCILLLGASGVGKTSLMKSIILPFLKNPVNPFKINITGVCEYEIPIQKENSFIQSFIRLLQNENIIESVFDQDRQIEQVRNNPSDLSSILVTPKLNNGVKVIFIDQLERIFVEKNQSKNEITLFFKLAKELLKSKKYFLFIALKHEYYADVMMFDGFVQIKKESIQYDLLSPSLSEITEIVNEPVAAAGLSYEFNTNSYESLNDIIISEAQKIGNILPILSHTLNQLCCDIDEENELKFNSYYDKGGLIGSLINKADDIYTRFTESEIDSFKNKLHYLIQFTPEKNNKIFCAKAKIKHFQNTPSEKIISYLIEAHLIQTEIFDNSSFISFIHETLLEESEFFKSWINDNQLSLSIINEIHTLSHYWQNNKFKSDYLLKNNFLLHESEKIIQNNQLTLESNDYGFIQASLKKYNHRNKIKSVAISALILLLLISFVLLFQHQKLNSQLNSSQQEAERLLNYMLDELNNKLRPIGKLDLLDDIGINVLNYYSAINHSRITDVSLLHRIEALNTLGEVKFKKGHLKESEEYFSTAISQYELYKNNFSVDTNLMFKISQTYYWLGYIYYVNNKLGLADKHWQSYFHTTQLMTKLEPNVHKWQLELSYALNNLGTLYYNNKKFDLAELNFDKSAKIKKTLLSKEPKNTQYMAELADTLSWQSSLLNRKNQLIESIKISNKSLELAKQLIKLEPENIIWKQRLGQAFYRLALKHYDLGELIKASELIAQSLPLFIQLHHNDNSNQQWLKELVNNYLLLAKIKKHQGLLDEAMVNINKVENYFQMYSTDSLNMKQTLIQQFDFIAESSLILLRIDKPKAAESQFKQISNVLDSLNEDENIRLFFIAYSQFILAQIQIANHSSDLAQSTLLQAAVYSEKILQTTPNSKEYLALNIAINKRIFNKKTDQSKIDLLNKIKYKNPDYITQQENI